jgi:hypothetical protein
LNYQKEWKENSLQSPLIQSKWKKITHFREHQLISPTLKLTDCILSSLSTNRYHLTSTELSEDRHILFAVFANDDAKKSQLLMLHLGTSYVRLGLLIAKEKTIIVGPIHPHSHLKNIFHFRTSPTWNALL